MRRLRFSDRGFLGELGRFTRAASPPAELSGAVASILGDVQRRGDRAVAAWARKFDGARLRPADFRVPASELAAASRGLSPGLRRAILAARGSIEEYHRRALPRGWSALSSAGARVGEKFDPIRRVGLYIPGGHAPLASTVLMTAVPARLAGCPEIAACTPAGRDGRIDSGLLAALHLAGVREVYRIGGVQAIGAMAYGTAAIPAVDKIFGPGNAYVCEAKRQVFGRVGVDALPGPSELMVIADGSARPDFAAADLLAQAEHGSGRERIYLVACAGRTLDAVAAEIEAQLRSAPRAAGIRRVLKSGFLAVEAASLDQAAAVANAVAPEHLELLVRRTAVPRLLRAITTAGAILVGNDSPTALADFVAGPSHVLPTAGTGRFSSGLRVADFMRRTSVVQYDRASLRRQAPVAEAFAALEGLDAHGRSVRIRL